MELYAVAVAEVIALASAANSAYAVIKKAVSNGRELSSVASSIGVMLDSETKLKDASKKKSSPFTNLLGKSASDFEAFQKLEEMKDNRNSLRSICMLYGKPGTWERFVQFEAEARRKRAEAQKRAEEEAERRLVVISYCIAGLIAASGFGGFAYYVLWYKGVV